MGSVNDSDETNDEGVTSGPENAGSEAMRPGSESEGIEPSETSREQSSTGLDENVAGALSYLLGPVTGVLFYVLEEDSQFVKFHAAQSTIVFGGLFVLGIVLSVIATVLAVIPVIGWFFAVVIGLVSLLLAPVGFIAWIALMVVAYQGKDFAVPIAGSYARRYADRDIASELTEQSDTIDDSDTIGEDSDTFDDSHMIGETDTTGETGTTDETDTNGDSNVSDESETDRRGSR